VSSTVPHTDPSHASSAQAAPPKLCLNCETALTGPFCARCGQHDVDYHRSFHHLAHDVLENLFHFDGKFLVSVAWLLARPGKLTNEFNAGRRASQVNPLRFYIFATVLFFLGVHLLNHGHLFDFDRRAADRMSVNFRPDPDLGETELARMLREAAGRSGRDLTDQEVAEMTQQVRSGTLKVSEVINKFIDAKAEAEPKEEHGLRLDENSAFVRSLKEKFSSGELTLSRIIDDIESRVPTLLFLGMPVFALLLKLLYLRSGRYYIEHLVFSLHLHTWMFLALMVSNGWFKLVGLGPQFLEVLLLSAFVSWLGWYVITAFRTVYGQGWRKTLLKLATLGFAYGAALLVMAVTLIVGTLAWLAYS
jgi:hypothetical protein